MSNTLFINACARPNSRTFELAKSVLEKTGGKVDHVNLYETILAPLDPKGLEKRDAAAGAHDFSDASFFLAKQFAAADKIVIAAPYWDLMFPSVVKIYIEAVTVNGLTFCYGDNGTPKGLCKAKQLIYVTTSGGPIIHNFGYEYISTLARTFYGIHNTQCIKAEGLDIWGADVEAILHHAKMSIQI